MSNETTPIDPLFHDQTYPGVDTNVRFEERTEAFGVVRLQYHPEGIALWVGGECRWRSNQDPIVETPRRRIDIVTRLRAAASDGPRPSLEEEAASEIEHLRGRMEKLESKILGVEYENGHRR